MKKYILGIACLAIGIIALAMPPPVEASTILKLETQKSVDLAAGPQYGDVGTSLVAITTEGDPGSTSGKQSGFAAGNLEMIAGAGHSVLKGGGVFGRCISPVG